MKICKNKRSNQYFIYIGKTGDGEGLLVTPTAEVKSLKLDLFGEVGEQEESYLLQNKIVTEAQVRRFHEHHKNRSDEAVENFEFDFEQLSSSQKENILKKLEKIFSGNSKM